MIKKRITYLDMAKGVGIILVVMLHSQLMNNKLIDAFAPMMVPLFFVVSGMLMNYTEEDKRSFKEIAMRKAKFLLIPYVVFSISDLLLYGYVHITNPAIMTGTQVLKQLIYFVSFEGISVMWFIPALFVAELYFLALRKWCSHKLTIAICIITGIVAILIAPVYQDHFWFGSMPLLMFSFFLAQVTKGVISAIFICFGYYVKSYLVEKEKIAILELSGGILLLGTMIALNIYNGRVDLHSMNFSNPVLYMIGANFGSLAIILICKNIPQIKLMIFLGANSLIIMVTHIDWLLMTKAQEWSGRIAMRIAGGNRYVFWLGITVIMLIMETILIFLINQYGYFLLGKRRPKERTLNIFKYIWENVL